MIVDFHTHVLPPRIKRNIGRYMQRDEAFGQLYSNRKAKSATTEELIEFMDRDGVDISVILNYSWSTHELCREINDYILESVARFPKRLFGFCAVSSYTDDISLAEVERCVKAGARGIGELRPDEQPYDYSDPSVIKPFREVLQKHRLMVLTHASEPVGHLYPGKGMATPELLYQFTAALDSVPVICAHWGGGLPFYSLMPEVMLALENVYFDTAASPFLYRPEIFRYVSEFVGVRKVLFGSDCPVLSAGRLLRDIDAAGLSEADRTEILSGNACRLLGI
jgi:predicted TIM-barrel fold metal-dependent hydrolase